MNKFGVLGWPLTNTFSPQIHELLFVHTGIKGSYSTIREENINQETILKLNQGFHGYNITIPHKEKILNLDDTAILSKSVLEIGACNTVLIKNSRMYLFNTDFSGFRDFLDMIDHNFNNKEVLILGSGGSSKAIAYSLKLLNIKYHIVSRSLRENTISYNDVPNLSPKIGMVINTTPVGMPPYENA